MKQSKRFSTNIIIIISYNLYEITYALNMTAGSMTFPNIQHMIIFQILDFNLTSFTS